MEGVHMDRSGGPATVAPTGPDLAGLPGRLASATGQAGDLRRTAVDQRKRSARRREAVRRRRQDTIQLIWQSRRLRYDRCGPITAVWNDDGARAGQPAVERLSEHPFVGSPGSLGIDELVNRLFEISLLLAALHNSLDGSKHGRVVEAIDRLDTLIDDVRRAAFRSPRVPSGPDPEPVES